MQVHNYMEDVVKNVMEEVLSERDDMCSCDKCKLDIVAWALNRLPSKYIVTLKGSVYTRLQELELQFKADVTKEITKAIEHIKDNPQH